MASLIPYLAGRESITPDKMNAVFGALDENLDTILGGRSFCLANRDRSFNAGGGSKYFPGTPYSVFGKCFYFTEGVTAYSQYLPGAIVRPVQVMDPVLGIVVTGSGVRSYSHEDFSNAAATATISSTDTSRHIATVPTHGDSFYTEGLVRIDGVSLFEHSLETHTRIIDGVYYYLKESGAPIPEKRYNYALADIIIEGMTLVNLAVCTLSRFKYKCLRIHNLQSVSCTVTMPDGVDVVLGPFECQSYRLNVAGTAFEESSMRYFQTFRGTDPRMFWFWNTLPSNSTASTHAEVVTTATGGMQGNNLSNPAVVYDFIQWLHDPRGVLRHARFNRNVHELCDQSALYAKTSADQAGKFAALNASGLTADAKVADLFWHTGTLKIKRVSRTQDDPRAPGIRLITDDEVVFRGVDTIVADFAAKQIAVTTNANGNLQLKSTDPDNSVDLIGLQTNLLKTTDYGGDAAYYIIPTARNIDAQIELEFKIFENNGGATGNSPNQNPYGSDAFNLLRRSNYRITQRAVVAGAVESRTYQDINGDDVTVSGSAANTLREVSLGAALEISGIHAIPVSYLTDLRYFGNSALTSQSDSYVTYSAPELALTPEGWVMTFTESVSAEVLPTLSDFFYENFIGNKFRFNPVTGRFEFKHAIRFRKHGFGFGQLGKANAAFFTPTYGRATVAGYEHEVSGPDGIDFGFPDQRAFETTVKVMRQISKDELADPSAGGRFMKAGASANLDGLVQFSINDPADYLWYPRYRFLMLSGNSSIPRLAGGGSVYLLAMPLEVPHYNGMAQAVNQIESGRVLDWRSIRIPYGSKVLDFDIDGANDIENGLYGFLGGLTKWDTFFGPPSSGPAVSLPAPISAFVQIVDRGPYMFAQWWRHFFGSRGVPIKTADDMQGWSDMRATGSTKGEWEIDVHIDVTIGAPRPSGLSDPNTVYSGQVNISVGDLEWSTEQVEVGSALVAVPGHGNKIALSQYAGIEWVSVGDFRGLMEALGVPFTHSEIRVPLVLGRLNFPDVERLGISNPSGSATVDVMMAATVGGSPNVSGAVATLNATERGGIFKTDETVNTVFDSSAQATSIHKQQVAFSQPYGQNPTWKISSTGVAWRVIRRTTGRSPLIYGVHFGTRMLTRATSVSVELERTLSFDYLRRYHSQPPWFPETGIASYGRQSGQAENDTIFTVCNYGDFGRVFYSHAEPETAQNLADAETLYRYLGSEELRMECFVESTIQAVTQDFYKVPQTLWVAPLMDWWEQSQDYRLASMLGVATTPQAFQSADGAISVVSCPPGVTEITPADNRKIRLLKEPLELIVPL